MEPHHLAFEHANFTDANKRFQNREALFENRNVAFQGRNAGFAEGNVTTRNRTRHMDIEDAGNRFWEGAQHNSFTDRPDTNLNRTSRSSRFENIRIRFENPDFQRFNIN